MTTAAKAPAENGVASVAEETAVLWIGGLQWSPTIGQIAKALVLAQGNMDEVRKQSVNPAFHAKYADLAACINAVGPALQGAGLALIQAPSSDGSIVRVETMFLHTSGEWIKSALGLRPVKSDPQGAGSAITYGRRYGLLGMCGIAPEKDDDGNAGSNRKREGTDATETRQPAAGNGQPPPMRELERRFCAATAKDEAAFHAAMKGKSTKDIWAEVERLEKGPQSAPAGAPEAKDAPAPQSSPQGTETAPAPAQTDLLNDPRTLLLTAQRRTKEKLASWPDLSEETVMETVAAVRHQTMLSRPDDDSIATTYDWECLEPEELRSLIQTLAKVRRSATK